MKISTYKFSVELAFSDFAPTGELSELNLQGILNSFFKANLSVPFLLNVVDVSMEETVAAIQNERKKMKK